MSTIRSAEEIPGDVTPENLLAIVDANPNILAQLKSGDTNLYDALLTKDVSKIRLVLMSRFFNRHKRQYEHAKEIQAIEADPMNEEHQRKIEEAIQNANIQQNMELAIENLPEAFATVQMLFVNLEINNHPIKAFIDSGAQSTIMSASCAERCNIMRLLDKRFAGQARGVGTGKILGRIHIAQMKFGRFFCPVSITVLETMHIDFLFGLDMLKRYNCMIDLDKNVLRLHNGYKSNGERDFEELHFLSEAEIPRSEDDVSEGQKPSSSNPPAHSAGGSSSSSQSAQPSSAAASASPSYQPHASSSSTATPSSTSALNPPSGAAAATTPAATAPTAASSAPSSSLPPLLPESSVPAPAPLPHTAAGGGGAAAASVPAVPASDSAAAAETARKVASLVELGFSEAEARLSLLQAAGNLELAVDLLMN